tara:strand:+ start:1247 stop:2038 length:792 start_codon:yes stop_codon:yes gene_type:complete
MTTTRALLTKVMHRLNRWRFRPNVKVESGAAQITLGSAYGGWTFEDRDSLRGSTIISAGLGEDASFDIEFARKYRAKVIIIDPTPRAIVHFGKIMECIGKAATQAYVDGGDQPTEAYPLDSINEDQLSLVDKALWTHPTTLKFYLPGNPDHVSHSVVNFQNNYAQDTPAIEVEAVTLEEVLEAQGIGDVALLKMDIEGAEVPVLKAMIDKGIRPEQLLIEFDELIKPSPRSRASFSESDAMLRESGYVCRYFDGLSNFLYTRE